MRSNPYRSALESAWDFPKPGVRFWDFTPLHQDPALFKRGVEEISEHFAAKAPTKIVAVEAKGFVLGGALAYALGLPLALVRKPGLTPGTVLSESFEKEYGTGEYQLKAGVIQPGDRALVVYDILAGPGATQAAFRLVERCGGLVIGAAYAIELAYLGGREALPGHELFALATVLNKEDL